MRLRSARHPPPSFFHVRGAREGGPATTLSIGRGKRKVKRTPKEGPCLDISCTQFQRGEVRKQDTWPRPLILDGAAWLGSAEGP
jgi:hypothetical protein